MPVCVSYHSGLSVSYHSGSYQYDRYLADVFVEAGAGDDLFLNQALLENGHADRKDAWEFTD